ncbi:MAG: UDP-N-acetylmuramate dehydrogenase [Actinobacteria bacterium]|nr:UDP-N-acetylmuramate dehydrogenase [Actinomycetota bacterium]
MTTRLAELTTMRVGGPAERVLTAHTKDELVQHALELWGSADPWLLLGGGSNTVVCDEGYPGTVLLVRNAGVDWVVEDDADGHVRLRVQAGQDWDALVAFCVEQGWSGIEALSGIPGLAGAAPIQNIGAYGAELGDVLHSIEFLDAESGEVVRLAAAELELGYRDSAIKRGREGVVLSIDLVLQTSDSGLSAPIAYAQLANALGVELGERVPLRSLREAVLALRASKGMVLDPEDHDTWSAGSFFTNPIVSEQFARTMPDDAPRFLMADEEPEDVAISFEDLERGVEPPVQAEEAPRQVKLSAAWLIEHSGVRKGFRIPGSGASISSKHTLAITNRGSASADDVAQLGRFVVQRVQQEFGVLLHPEPNLYGLEL